MKYNLDKKLLKDLIAFIDNAKVEPIKNVTSFGHVYNNYMLEDTENMRKFFSSDI